MYIWWVHEFFFSKNGSIRVWVKRNDVKWHNNFQRGLCLLLLLVLDTEYTTNTCYRFSDVYIFLVAFKKAIWHETRMYIHTFTQTIYFSYYCRFFNFESSYISLSEWQVKWSIFSSEKFHFKDTSIVKVCLFEVLGFYLNARCCWL